MLKVVGFKKKTLNYEGKTYDGTTIHCTYEGDSSNGITGTAVTSFFLTDSKAKGYVARVGQNIELVYNRFGKVDSVNVKA